MDRDDEQGVHGPLALYNARFFQCSVFFSRDTPGFSPNLLREVPPSSCGSLHPHVHLPRPLYPEISLNPYCGFSPRLTRSLLAELHTLANGFLRLSLIILSWLEHI